MTYTRWPDDGLSLLERRSRLLCKAASMQFGVRVDQIRGRRRFIRHVKARHWVWRQLRREGFSFPAIGEEFEVDHSSVQYACKRQR